MRSYIRNTKYFNRTSFCSAVLLIGTLALLFFPLVNKTNNTEAIPAQSETTLTLSTSDINMTFAVDSTNGTFSSSDPANITVNTNNYTGYTLNIANTTNDDNYNKLVNVGDNNYYLNSISSASTPEEFNTNNWGILLNKTTGDINTTIDTTKYQPAPDLDGSTLDTTDRANNEPNTYDIKLGVKADYSARVGTYTNSFTITAVANPVGYTITYNKNTEDEVENMPAEQIGDVGSSDVTIPNTTPTRRTADFLGWCNTTPTTTNGLDQCTGTNATTYQPGDTIHLSQASNNNYDLYAMWKKTTINDLTYLQDFASLTEGKMETVVESMTTNDAYTLIDNRDNTTYHISKLADGRIWFLDNLALDLTNATVKSKLTPATTNATATSISKLINGGGTTSDQYATAGVSSNWTSSTGNSYSAPLINMASKDVVPNNAPTGGKGYNKVGGYYNFCAASAGSYCYGNGTDFGTPSGNATEDICPAGWRLPTGSTTGEYSALANQIYGSTDKTNDATAIANYRATLSVPLSGYFSNGSASNQGSSGLFRSSTRNGDFFTYILSVSTSYVNPSSDSGRESGHSVRCLVRNSDIVIIYNANGGTGEMTKQTITDAQVVAGTNQLTANTFTRDGYQFAGWNTKADGSGTSYPNGTLYIGPSTTLYAQWTFDNFESTFASAGKSKVTVGSNQYYKMQDINTDICNTINTGLSGQLVDIRDNTIYNVGKLPDGRCWLLDNLALDLTNSTVLNNMTPNNTNASATSLTALRSGNRSAGDQYATAGVGNLTSGSSYSAPLVNMASKDVVPNNAPTGSKGNNKVGGYYNYCAASAGSYCYGNGTDYGTSSGNATEDICPAGWRMPTGDTTGEYGALANQIYGSTGGTYDATAATNYRNALSLPLSGNFRSGSVRNQGSSGLFWSSTRNGGWSVYTLSVSTSYVSPSNGQHRIYGLSVRCLVKY